LSGRAECCKMHCHFPFLFFGRLLSQSGESLKKEETCMRTVRVDNTKFALTQPFILVFFVTFGGSGEIGPPNN